MTPKRKAIYATLAILSWALLVAALPSKVHWRDSGEFLLGAYFLDIVHTAGFPLTSFLGNALSLIPIGPIPFRLNALAALSTIGVGAVLSYLTLRILTELLTLSPAVARILALLPATILIGSSAFWRQSLLLEAYQLNAFLLLTVLALFLENIKRNDLRFLYLATFIAGLSLANHASALLSYIVPLLIVVFASRYSFRALKVSVIMFAIGASVYLYIPLRADHTLPLNTGGIASLDRLSAFLTNSRDRNLRPEIKGKNLSTGVMAPGYSGLKKDLKKLTAEIPSGVCIAAILGVIILLFVEWQFGLAALSVALGNWIFFHRWDSDPWIPLMAVIAVFCTVAIGWFLKQIREQDGLVAQTVSVFLICLAVISGFATQPQNVLALKHQDVADQTIREVLGALPSNSTVVVEATWFVANYLQRIEGVRTDVNLVYQPQILFPAFFNRVVLKANTGVFDTWNSNPSGELAKTPYPSFETLQRFVRFAAAKAPLSIEPSQILNTELIKLLSPDQEYFLELKQNRATQRPEPDQGRYLQFLNRYTQRASRYDVLKEDSLNFIEISVYRRADLLLKQNYKKLAASVCQSLCDSALGCSKNFLFYTVQLLIEAEDYEAALATVLNQTGSAPPVDSEIGMYLNLAAKKIGREKVARTHGSELAKQIFDNR